MLAVIYYDVKDQYGDSIKSSTSINWTISSSNSYTVDKNVGRITVRSSAKNGNSTNTDRNPFIYGTQISITGVHAKTGKMVNKILTVGQEQAVDEVKPIGFLNKDKKKEKPTKDLPKDFQKNTYVLLYETLDQQGNPIEASSVNIAGDPDGNTPSYVTFVTVTPEYITNDFKDDAIYTVDMTDDKIDNPIEYSSVTIQPGMYVDRGGEATIKAIANRTGRSNLLTFNIGKAAMLQSVQLFEPAKTVADGDINVEIPYEARDAEGNLVTKYETLARSTNSLRMSTSAGSLILEEQEDGTGKFFWTDDDNYTEHRFDSTKVNVADGSDRIVALTTVVVGGESGGNNTLLLSVSDMRRPTTVNEAELKDPVQKSNDRDKVIIANNGNDNSIVEEKSYELGLLDMTYYDQYGELMTRFTWREDLVRDFWRVVTANKDIGGTHYGFEVEALGNSSMGFEGKRSFLPSDTGSVGNTSSTNKIPIYASNDHKYDSDKCPELGHEYDEKVGKCITGWIYPNGNNNNSDISNASNDLVYNTSLFRYKTNTNGLTAGEVGSVTVKYSILAKASSDSVYSNAGKAKAVNYTIVPVEKVTDYKISVGASKVGITTNNTINRNGEDLPATQAALHLDEKDEYIASPYPESGYKYVSIDQCTADNRVISVSGTYKGSKLILPNSSLNVYDGIDCYSLPESNSYVSAFGSDVLCSSDKDSVEAGYNKIVAITGSAIRWGNLYNFNTAKNERTDTSAVLTARIYTDFDKNGKRDDSKYTKISTSFKVSDEAPGLASVSLAGGTIFATNTNLKLGEVLNGNQVTAKNYRFEYQASKGVSGASELYRNHLPYVSVLDQYGQNYIDLAKGQNVSIEKEYTVSGYKENSGELAHLVDSSIVNKNGSDGVIIDGAEIGDTFTVTVKVKAGGSSVTKTATADFKVGPDRFAIVSTDERDNQGTDGKSKEASLRKTLKYDR